MGEGYLDVIKVSKTKLLRAQAIPEGYAHSYFTFGALFTGEQMGITWHEFRKKYIEFGGDGIFAAWKTVNNEPCFKNNNIGYGEVPIAETLQKNLMQFTANQKNEKERGIQLNALKKTIQHFDA